MRHLATLTLLLVGTAAGQAREVYQDLRGKAVDEELFHMHGPDADRYIRSEAEGLRIVLPPGTRSPVGLATALPVRGDFEIVVGYELLQAQRQTTGSGMGLEIYLSTSTPAEDAVAFYRVARPKEGEVYMCDKKRTEAGNRATTRRVFPTECRAGRLRITRTGAEVIFAAAEGGDDFKELCRHDWDTMDVKSVGARAFPGQGAETPLDLRITEIRIRDQNESAALPGGAAPARSSGRRWLLTGVLGATSLGLLWAWRFRSRGRRAETVDSPAGVSFFCFLCGKALRAGPPSLGKRVVCAHCGHSVPVPDKARAEDGGE